MPSKLKQATDNAHAALEYAIINGTGIQDANIALDAVIDAYYDSLTAVKDAHAVKRYETLANVSTQCQSCLNAIFGGVT